MSSLFAELALLPDGWARDVRIEIDANGGIRSVTPGGEPNGASRVAGPLIPGMPDLHGHAFQRAMAGLAEIRADANDDFWSWRRAMYGLVERLRPDQAHAIASQLYLELLAGGFTSVCEFHYLHHDVGGASYAREAEMSLQVVAAAQRVGLGITHLPVLYERGGFRDEPLRGGQERFRTDPDGVLRLVEAVRSVGATDPQVTAGLALHSLRAVRGEHVASVTRSLHEIDATSPVHIHIAEQTAEVDECVATTGQRPVRWLLEHAPVDPRWCLVHATHLDEDEVRDLAGTGAIAGLCPTTEANLGDGLFPFGDFRRAGGAFGIGTDSHVGRGAPEELRCLEYGQRLLHRRRNLAATDATPSVGTHLWLAAVAGGAAATGRPVDGIRADQRADLVVLDPDLEDFTGIDVESLLGVVVFSAGRQAIRDVMVGGRWVIQEGRHPLTDEVSAAYRKALRELRSA